MKKTEAYFIQHCDNETCKNLSMKFYEAQTLVKKIEEALQ